MRPLNGMDSPDTEGCLGPGDILQLTEKINIPTHLAGPQCVTSHCSVKVKRLWATIQRETSNNDIWKTLFSEFCEIGKYFLSSI